MEEMAYILLFRWFVGLNADDEVCDATTFTKKRESLAGRAAGASTPAMNSRTIASANYNVAE
jgi:IS5 family transposase